MDNRHIQFRDGLTEADQQVDVSVLRKLQRLFQVGAFWAGERCLEDWAVAIANSYPIISVWDREELIGFARATSDGIYRAMVWDVVIHPDYRGQGLGRQLVQTLLAHPQMNRVERIYLTTTHQQSFYEHIGFVSNSSTTMVLNQEVDVLSIPLDHSQTEALPEQ
ncbi:GNAT family N-acetyltransferase [Acaryochloris sp. 'Moss Beach']|uniref:GNAT family N-acetyltransferase n=1 Tax=Acaryochloris sp. 'Moss Beach' TaxID=2740837 RepID=UPI001F2C4A9B|nr:GNAT family N-acetyltransferase [Acaryochloris sp. 'Moss Beach']UJB70779.1 GNAT family N-acetyltransferase [Acaryochloris sp. 'Moss Beach']